MQASNREPLEYKASITREQFMFYEMRTTAKLLMEGLTDEEVIHRIVSENLFQYPTEKLIRSQALACLKRLHGLNDESLVAAIATQPSETAKKVCLYAMMKYNRLVWDFMVTVVGEKFRNRDMSSARRDSIHEILDGSIRRVIERCKKAATTGAGLEPLDVDVLKLLYQI